jgi:CDP-diacylglycerol---glycerol-3-phosphate 3-phosphatidyltransferase
VNLPNKLTLGRLVITAIFFVFLALRDRVSLDVSLGLFVIATITDLIDGWLARKYQMVTDFGRVADPFADKILICGALIFLLAKNGTAAPDGGVLDTRVRDWMVVVILAREFLVSAMRSFAESKGTAFGANYWGKFKALAQNFAVGFSILYVANPEFSFVKPVVDGVLYFATAMTAISGFVYLVRAKRILHLDT